MKKLITGFCEQLKIPVGGLLTLGYDGEIVLIDEFDFLETLPDLTNSSKQVIYASTPHNRKWITHLSGIYPTTKISIFTVGERLKILMFAKHMNTAAEFFAE